jgi:peptidoglycan/LPS O-acetylase OafA/YrhL
VTEPATVPLVTKLGYRPELDGLRGLAIALVVSLHVSGWPRGGFLGVDAFFTLSGFLITTILLQEWQAGGTISLRNFYVRRVLRLVPGLACLLLVYALVAVALGGVDRNLRLRGVLYSAVYVANWPQAFDLAFPKEEMGYIWSLAVEEQFYLLWPLSLVCLLRSGGLRPQRLTLILVATILALAAWTTFLTLARVPGPRLYFGTDARLNELLVGCLFGVIWTTRLGTPSALARLSLNVAAVAGMVFLGWRIFGTHYWVPWWSTSGLTLTAVAVGVVIYASVTESLPVLTKALGARWLGFIGTISYSLYLWHVPAVRLISSTSLDQIEWISIPLKILLSVGAACGSYYWIELPFLRTKQAFASARSSNVDQQQGSSGVAPANPRLQGSDAVAVE